MTVSTLLKYTVFWPLLLFIFYVLGVEFPTCVPGKARACSTHNGAVGVQYCRRRGFGFEACQPILTSPYPQALWKQ